MFYPKNVPNVERVLRIGLSLILIGLALFGQSLFGSDFSVSPLLLIGTAVALFVTGFIGWCPACAMVGRKLKSNKSH